MIAQLNYRDNITRLRGAMTRRAYASTLAPQISRFSQYQNNFTWPLPSVARMDPYGIHRP
jgi:hypothetical protein